jgi:uncharacterized SAM-binding protein YcdF (DUF218 family)
MALSGSTAAAVSVIWSYLQLNHDASTPADAILVLGSNDERVAHRGIDLFLAGVAPTLLFSGGVGALTAGQYGGLSEAEFFARLARARGVPDSSILVEGASTNTGENIRFSRALLEARGVRCAEILLVQKPFMERRTLATFLAQWGAAPVPAIRVTSPRLSLDEYPLPHVHRLALADVIETMMGDLQRIAIYPARGFQVFMEIPQSVWDSLRLLIREGFTGPQLILRAGAAVGSRDPADYDGLGTPAPPPAPSTASA